MKSFDTIRSIVTGANDILETAVAEMPTELLNKVQPGNANTIGAIYAHAIINLDTFYIGGIQGKSHLLVANGFAAKMGIQQPTSLDWEVLNSSNWDLEILHSYAQVIFDEINKYINNLSHEELGRVCPILGREMTVEQIIAVATWHTALHAGEIAALKGINEMKGLPF